MQLFAITAKHTRYVTLQLRLATHLVIWWLTSRGAFGCSGRVWSLSCHFSIYSQKIPVDPFNRLRMFLSFESCGLLIISLMWKHFSQRFHGVVMRCHRDVPMSTILMSQLKCYETYIKVNLQDLWDHISHHLTNRGAGLSIFTVYKCTWVYFMCIFVTQSLLHKLNVM